MAPHPPSVMKSKDGKYMTVRKFKDELKLFAADLQKTDNKVHIQRRVINKKNQIALYFQRGNNYYYPTVDGNRLTLEEKAGNNIPENISESSWFEKQNLGNAEYYGLRSVTEPPKYLSLDKKKKFFILVEALKKCVPVTDKTV